MLCRGSGSPSLSTMAIAASRKLAHRLFKGKQDSQLDYHGNPNIIFSHPPISTMVLIKGGGRHCMGGSSTGEEGQDMVAQSCWFDA